MSAAMTSAITTKRIGTADVVLLAQLNDVYHIDMRADYARDDSMILPRVGTVLENARKRLGSDRVHLCLPGDFLGPSCLSKHFHGKQMVAVLNSLQARFVSLGNHEFDTKNSDQNILECMNESAFTWIATNFEFSDRAIEERFSDHPQMKPAAVVEISKGIYLCLLGLLYAGSFGGVGRATDPIVEAQRMIMHLEGKLAGGSATATSTIATYLGYLQGRPDSQYEARAAYVAMTHQHSEDDRKLAVGVPHLMAILGGHDHDVRNRHDILGSHIGKALSNARTLRLNWFVAVRVAELQKIAGFGQDVHVLIDIANELYEEVVIPQTQGLLVDDSSLASKNVDRFRSLFFEYFGPGASRASVLSSAAPAKEVGGLVDAGAARALSCRVVRDRFVFAYSLALDTQHPAFIDLVAEQPEVRATIEHKLAQSPESTTPIMKAPVPFVIADAQVRRRSTNFGNFVADILSGRRKERNPTREETDIGLVNSGGFRLDRDVRIGEAISRQLLCDIFYHDNEILRFVLKGTTVERIVQECAQLRATPDASHGDFLQLSGLRVRVQGGVPTSIECRDIKGSWSNLLPDVHYKVATTKYVARLSELYAPLFEEYHSDDLESEIRVAVREEFEALACRADGPLAGHLKDLDEERWRWN
jgi:2',3'-cyclic-nucleotide 2'-phosphodiesterase (5'-nucleotidase family)